MSNVETGEVLEFVDEEIEALQDAIAKRMGFKIVDHRMELCGSFKGLMAMLISTKSRLDICPFGVENSP